MANQSISEAEIQLRSENEELQQRLTEAEETLYAIRNGEVDAIVVSGAEGARIFSLTSAETPYRIMVEEMHEGAATLMADTTVLHCNSRFAEMVARPAEQIIGASFCQFISENEKSAFTRLFKAGLAGKSNGEITWLGPENEIRYYHLSFSPLPPDVTGDVCIIVSDFTERKQAEETLHAHVFLNSVIENSPNALWILDKQGTLNQMNQASRNLFKIPDQDLTGNYNILKDTVFEEQGFKSLIHDVFEKASIVRFVARYGTASGRGIQAAQILKLDLDVSISPILDAHGKVTNAVVQFTDITDHKKTEQELRESERKFRNLVWNMPVGVLIQGLQSEMLLSNHKALELLGLTEDQLLGKTSFDPDWNVIHEDGSPFPGETHPVPQAIATGLPVRDVIMGVYNPINGNRAWLLVDAIPQLNADGKIRQVVCTFVDISKRKEAEEEVIKSYEKLMKFASQVPGMLYQFERLVNGSFRVPFTTESIRDIFGCSPEDVLHDFAPVAKVIHPEDLAGVYSKIEESLLNMTSFKSEYRVLLPGQPVHWIYARSMPERMPNGSVIWNGFNTDITQQKQAEADLQKKMDELLQFQRLTVGRELKMIELKKEINEILKGSGKDEKYRIVE
jgi:PAS domain S-box-containing protein